MLLQKNVLAVAKIREHFLKLLSINDNIIMNLK
jgi:hypothetical protein